ncbi:hypothetical protein HDU97_006707 [Phlyctochytrium planicorne]|nr:hypothetical protein HDU97_006707 [Phlyctochytrium planicorne]
MMWILPLLALLYASARAQNDVAYVGILHSQTGTLAISEISVIQAELLAIDEINKAGGVLGKKLVPVVRDGASDPPTFAAEAQKLVNNASIVNVFGCWTSSSRKAVRPIFEASKIMLWYPVQYEGQECSSSIIYSGAAPNQQLEPAVRWLLQTYPKYPFFLLGSDYVFPRTANAIIKAMLNTLGRPLKGERYCVLPKNAAEQAANSLVIDSVIEQMKQQMPDGGIVFNTLNGDANVDFFTKLNQSGLRPDKYPVLSVSISETEVSAIGVQKLIGHFASWNYFMTDPAMAPLTDADYLSRTFIQNFWKKYNDTSLLLNDPMEAAYMNVYMWALAVERAQTFEATKVRMAAYNQRFDAPEGTVQLRSNHHFAKYVRIGRLASSGRFDVVFETQTPVQPQPWNQYIDETRGYVCDHRQVNGSFYRPPSINSVLLYRSAAFSVLDTQNAAIDMINSNLGGIDGKRIVATIINLDWPQAVITDAIMNITKINPIDVVFGTTLTADTWSKWTQAMVIARAFNSTLQDPITFIPPDFRPPCAKNIVYLGLSARQVISPTYKWLSNQNINGLFFIGEEANQRSSELFSQVNSTLASSLPKTSFMGSCNVGTAASTDACLKQLTAAIMATPTNARLVVIDAVGSQSPYAQNIFTVVSNLIASRSQKIFVITTSAFEKSQLSINMTGHFSVGSYFSDISVAENAVFVSSLKAVYGRDFDPSEATQTIFTALSSIYSTGVVNSKSLDSDLVRISSWGSYHTPSGPITLNMNNQLSAVPRIAQVINLGGNLKYRLVYGDTADEANLMDPIKGEGIDQEEACYFGPVIEVPSSLDGLRIACCAIALLCIVVFAAGIVFVIIYRNMLVIRHSGAHFLILSLVGCIINVCYIFILTPVKKTNALCIAEFWPLHAGFIIVFSGLLQKVYTIFQTTQRRKFLKSQGNAHTNFWKQVSAACFIFLCYMILRSILQHDDVEHHHEDIVPGVRIQETSYCKAGVWEWSILGVEVLMVIIGIGLSLQIRDVPSAFNESFHFGMAIYIWAFIKILNEVFLLFLPFNYQMYYAMKAVGELIPSIHTALMFLYPKVVAIMQSCVLNPKKGKGNEHVKTGQTSYESSQANSQTSSATRAARSRTVGTRSFKGNSEKVPPVPQVPIPIKTASSDSEVDEDEEA